jgi:hypothetical protein
MVRTGVGYVAALVLLVVAPALAHHSPAAFDRTKQESLTGTVKEFRWQNPHSWILLEVADETGEAVVWSVEMTSPTYLVRAGWRSNTIKPGDTITVTVNPVRSGEPSGMFVSLRLEDGQELTERPARLGGQ